MLRPNIQFCSDDGGDPTPAVTQTPPSAPEDAKTFSADYVSALREENKNHRLRAKTLEKGVRTAFALGDDEEIGDLAGRLSARESKILETANNRLIAAELRALEGYDQKLLGKVISLTEVKVDENGNVTGIKEAAEAAAKEFPAVKIGNKKPFAPLNPAEGGSTSPHQIMNDLIRGKR